MKLIASCYRFLELFRLLFTQEKLLALVPSIKNRVVINKTEDYYYASEYHDVV